MARDAMAETGASKEDNDELFGWLQAQRAKQGPRTSSTFAIVAGNASPWRSLGMSFALQHHHSTLSKGHIKSFHEQSLVAQC